MEKYIIGGGKSLDGEVSVQSAKNSVLLLISCSIMTDEVVVLKNCPKISDVESMIKIVTGLGGKITWRGDDLVIDASHLDGYRIDGELTKSMRSSIFLLGSLSSRLKRAEICYPGGCDIGLRPIDLHIMGLKQLGAEISDGGGKLTCQAEKLQGAVVHLDYPSVGATENIVMAAALAHGRTVVKNAAKEPEIVDLQRLINRMGGMVYGAGSSTIVIEGVKKLHGAEFTPIPDRIVAGTYLLSGAITGGKVLVRNANEEHIYSLIVKLRESACKIVAESDKIYIEAPKRVPSCRIIETAPYPGFATDLQAQMLALQTVANGTCILQENLFETRFKHVGELMKMGADIVLRGKLAIIKGVPNLSGAKLSAYDLRGGAALVLAALRAEGTSEIDNVCHIERGYVDIVRDLKHLGADIERVKIGDETQTD